MDISCDPVKNRRNIVMRGISFAAVRDMDFGTAIALPDRRRDYGEERWQVLGMINGRLHMLVFTWRGETMHVISLRKANKREVKCYEQAARS
ncbi:MAG TPA: BrnT family toxin [Advenella kashmirensis]|uniref:BrnT family toxin n=2 Tax=Advenella TaxID=290425 RepID=A0A356LG02_9BURK|nr:BrnT family toxin [Advenella kashmirensis]